MFIRADLMVKTVDELRSLAKELGIPGMSKKRKDIIVDAILAKQSGATPPVTSTTTTTAKVNTAALTSLVMTMKKTSGKVSVSCGANSGEFAVVGKAVYEVHEFLQEVLNIPKDSSYTVSGKNVTLGYIIQEGDTLEFIKRSGSKG